MGTNQYGFIFDNIGNRETYTNNSEVLTYLANSLNLYTNIADGVTNTPTYDLDGNMLTHNGWTYSWNGENRLVKTESLPSVPDAAKVKVENLYDYMGRRVRKTVRKTVSKDYSGSSYTTTNVTTYVWDGFNIIAEMCDASYTNWYTYGLDLSGTLQGAGGVGGALAMTRDTGTATNTYLYCFDGNGNVVNLIDASDGSIAATYEYSPFGSLIRSTGTMADDNPVRWSTKHTDDETGLVMYPYRPYNPETGRFLSRDPIEERGGLNLYGCVRNNPINGVDPLGLVTSWDLWQWLRWLLNTPDEAERLSWEDFDPDGTAENMLIMGWKLQNRDVLEQICESAPDGHSEHNPSTTEYVNNEFQNLQYVWISQWTGKSRLSSGGVGLDKNTDARCVCDFEFGLDLEATDMGDFNPGDRFGWHDIMRDDWFIWLRDNTIFGGDYEMYATGYSLETWTIRYGD